jgi:hypothetical protein
MRSVNRPQWPTRRRKEWERRSRKRSHHTVSPIEQEAPAPYNTNPDAYRKAKP